VLAKLKKRLLSEAFITTSLAIVINPVYIIRNGLYKSIKQIAPTLTGDILDFGCGSKPYESLFTGSTNYFGVDIYTTGHNCLNCKADYFYDGKTLPFDDCKFDAIVCFEVFEHVPNIDEVLLELHRILKIDGQLLISVPFAWHEHEIPNDFVRYTSFGITHFLNKNGFLINKIEKTTTYFLAIGQLFIGYLCQYVLPQGRKLGWFSQLLVIFPITLVFLALNYLLPKRYGYFCNCVVLAKKCI
jgi:SAM-dependent methyltransferase